ncbi:putative RNA-directed DNA polymerase from mobile element jockey-like [Apostichopus japonicus]|uniref:Putative RNA-directed DNA polymerase from mobile element jockey-like n=1 Tax=Stichopus japonicus TaxID=307972 RepID=A0A2G8KBU7_STIJA|nr:putative RNA-directed DNA polymerase from mobile element jockey-like [Apostichopus japonicus]
MHRGCTPLHHADCKPIFDIWKDTVLLKTSRVTPLLKKANLCKNDLNNYRPISSLKVLFKTIERVGFSQINEYLHRNNPMAEKQSAYRKFHSTETALLRVYNDLLQAVDHHQDAALILLDFSGLLIRSTMTFYFIAYMIATALVGQLLIGSLRISATEFRQLTSMVSVR